MSRPFQFQVAPFTRAIKWLVIVNVLIWFVFQVLAESFFRIPVTSFLAMTPSGVLFEYKIWELFTYMFAHSTQVTHILFNMLMLWFFGSELEQKWGSRRFLIYYFATGIGAALIYILGNALYAYVTQDAKSLVVPVIGASGALFGVMVAYGILFGDRTVYFLMLFPMKARIFVALMGMIEFSNLITSHSTGREVAYLAHLGGILSGLIFFGVQKWWKKIKNPIYQPRSPVTYIW